jgi:hypothetical protein
MEHVLAFIAETPEKCSWENFDFAEEVWEQETIHIFSLFCTE